MRVSRLLLSLALALAPGLAFAEVVGECGATGKQVDGTSVACKCDERPKCDQEGACTCEPDPDCRKDSCRGASSTLAHLEPVRPFDLPLGAR